MEQPQAEGASGPSAAKAPEQAGGEASAAAKTPQAPSRARRIWIQVLIWGTTILAVLAILAIWANRQMLNPNNWSKTSTKLLQNPQVREATSNYLVDQLYANVDVAGELNARLPSQLKPLAAPIAGGLRNLATEAAQRALANPRVQEAWAKANKAADETLVAVVKGKKGVVLVNGGEVSLDLSSIVQNITNRLGLPNVSSKLPPNVAHLKILKSDQIELVQKGGRALKGVALALTIIVPLLYALAIVLARGFRRRALLWVGIAAITAGIIVFLARNLLITQVTDSLVKSEAVKPAAQAVITIATGMMSEIAGAFVLVGAVLFAAAWFAGPARLAVKARGAIAPFLREQPGWTYGIVAGIMGLIFIWQPIPATGKLAGIIVFFALAMFGTYLLRRQTAEEFPPEAGGRPAAGT
jgi:hypothetical protein